MQHNVKDVAIRIVSGLAEHRVPSDIGMGALSLALVITAKQKGFTDEQIVDAFKGNIAEINKDLYEKATGQ